MTKSIIAALTLAFLMSEASAQSREYYRQFYGSATDTSDTTPWTVWRAIYDTSGKIKGSITTDSKGTVTHYNANGWIILNRGEGSTTNYTGICHAFRWNPPDD